LNVVLAETVLEDRGASTDTTGEVVPDFLVYLFHLVNSIEAEGNVLEVVYVFEVTID